MRTVKNPPIVLRGLCQNLQPFKGRMTRDFQLQVFFMIKFPPKISCQTPGPCEQINTFPSTHMHICMLLNHSSLHTVYEETAFLHMKT